MTRLRELIRGVAVLLAQATELAGAIALVTPPPAAELYPPPGHAPSAAKAGRSQVSGVRE